MFQEHCHKITRLTLKEAKMVLPAQVSFGENECTIFQNKQMKTEENHP